MSWWRIIVGPKKDDSKVEEIAKHMTEVSESVESKSAALEREVVALKKALTERTAT